MAGCSTSLIVLLLAFLGVTLSDKEGRSRSSERFLFRASQGGDSSDPPGLWGGPIDILNDGVADDLNSYGYETRPSDYYTSFSVTSLSHDRVRSEATVLLEHSDHKIFALARGPLCEEDAGTLKFLLPGAELVDNDHPFLMEAACGWKCGMGPVEVRNGTIYFVLTAVYGKVLAQLKREIQIRELQGCEHMYGVAASEFPILNCSRLVSVISSQPYEWPEPTLDVWMAAGLRILPSNLSSRAQFVLQTFESTSSVNQMHLSYTRENSSVVTKLFTRNVDSAYTGRNRIRGLGAVDYLGNILCWTAADTLMCSSYVGGELHNPFTLISPGEAVTQGACAGNLPSPALERTLTGLALAEIGSSLTIFFSCYAELRAVGGVGQVHQTNHGLVKTIHPVTSSTRPVFGGALFLANDVNGNGCDVKDAMTSTTAPMPPGTPSASASWGSSTTPSADKPDDSPILGAGSTCDCFSKYSLVTWLLLQLCFTQWLSCMLSIP